MGMIVALPLLIGLPSSLHAEDVASLDYFALDMEDLMAMDLTSLPTKTTADSLHSPGIITVLHGEQLRQTGRRNVLEALGAVPGLYINDWVPVMRGIGNVWNSGKILFQLNGVPMTEQMGQEYAPYLLPVEFVDRIEIIRGPGSALYGKGAYLAVINVVTIKGTNRVLAEAGSFDSYSAGAALSTSGDAWSADLALWRWERSDTERTLESDILTGTPISQAPGPIADAKGDPLSGVLALFYGGFQLKVQSQNYDNASNIGITGALPPFSNKYVQIYRMHMAEAGWSISLPGSSRLELKAGVKTYEQDFDESYVLFPPGFAMGPYTYPQGMLGGPHYEDRSYYASADFATEYFENHSLLIGVAHETTELTDAWQTTNYDPITYAPTPTPVRYDGAMNWIREGALREVASVYAQDIYSLTPEFKVTAGARYDRYSDSDSAFAPRVAIVVEPVAGNILKIQYAEASRAPTFSEMYMKNNPVALGNPGLTSETIETVEVQVTMVRNSWKASVSGFHSRMRGIIDMVGGQWRNSASATSKGVELEAYARPMEGRMDVSGSVSYADATDSATGKPVPGSVDWLGNVALRYRVADGITALAEGEYQGEADRPPTDPRPSPDGFVKLNLSADLNGILMPGLALGAGVNNVLDEGSWYIPADWPSDIPQPGRTWWVKAAYDF